MFFVKVLIGAETMLIFLNQQVIINNILKGE